MCDGKGRPLILLLSEGQMSDFGGAALMIDAFPKAKALLGDKGYVSSFSGFTCGPAKNPAAGSDKFRGWFAGGQSAWAHRH